MTRVVVSSKKNSNILQDGQIKAIILDQPSIVQIGVNQDDIKSIMKQGNDLVITLKNGEKIIISDFYTDANVTEHTLAFPEEDGSYSIAQFDDSGQFVRYVPTTQLTQFAYTQPPSQTIATSDGAEDLGITKSQLLKAGLVALAAEGLYLLAVKDDDDDKKKSEPQEIDRTPPVIKAVIDTKDSQTITVKTEANAAIKIIDKNGQIIATGQADAQGNYTFKLPTPLPAGENVTVTATDSAGNTSKSDVIGNKDVTAPDAPTAQLNADGTIVTGKTEANAKVSIYDADGKLLGTVTANKQGLYSIKVSPPLTSEKGGTVVAEDAAGNKSTPSKVFAGKDTVAPDQPTVEVNKEGTSIVGRAEANSKVVIKDADGKVIGSGTTDAQGKFEISLSPALAADKKGSVVLEDAAGNVSKPLEITAGKDTIAPDKAAAQINAAGDTVTGIAEANSKVEIKGPDGKTIGTGTVGADGKFTITISPALTDKNIGKVYIIDAAGNRSDATDVLGAKDTIAPNKPVLQTVTDDVGPVKGAVAAGANTDDTKPTLSGIGEAKAVLTIYDNGQPVGTVTVGDNGKWSFNFTQELGLGAHKITLTQTDAAGNISEMSDGFSFNVVAPTTTASLQSEAPESAVAQASLVDSINLDAFQAKQVAASPSSSSAEKLNLNELLSIPEQSSSQVDDVLNQIISTQTPSTTATGSSSHNVESFDFVQTIRTDPLDQLDVLQHSII
ncbi:Ig-like repeat protein Blp2 [Acinetobacter vivianii]|uniref:Ig-like repeat protein Blp2 n=1 Tax=Acinetobacter vivianii TaxID=1776742 RepID=UPI002DBE4283|nr:Ig-like repeat protein Blp2 [Acinetobacter vivianii]MEB6480474.1 Ig-like repeat protein Blp2 [Acinetobacter vivianii]MEB6656493.1 Ig-like repeat protein Blp2 [Acinetobacter vivianii]